MTLPILLTVPHSGRSVPWELRERICLTPLEIERDGDEEADRIYDLAGVVKLHHDFAIARCVLDLNRPEDDRRPDGVVKQVDIFGTAVWHPPLEEPEIEVLLARYYRPWHARVRALAEADDTLLFGLDGHTMAALAPSVARDAGAARPVACLSDGGGRFPPAWRDLLAALLAEHLGADVAINEPFKGGWITREHGRRLPWVQLELRRGGPLSVMQKHLAVKEALAAFCERLRP